VSGEMNSFQTTLFRLRAKSDGNL